MEKNRPEKECSKKKNPKNHETPSHWGNFDTLVVSKWVTEWQEMNYSLGETLQKSLH